MSSGTAVAVVLAVAAGLAGAIQAAVMGELGDRVGIVPALAFAVLVSLTCALTALLVWERSFAGVRAALHEPAWLWLGGVMSVYIVFAITVGPPRPRRCDVRLRRRRPRGLPPPGDHVPDSEVANGAGDQTEHEPRPPRHE